MTKTIRYNKFTQTEKYELYQINTGLATVKRKLEKLSKRLAEVEKNHVMESEKDMQSFRMEELRLKIGGALRELNASCKS